MLTRMVSGDLWTSNIVVDAGLYANLIAGSRRKSHYLASLVAGQERVGTDCARQAQARRVESAWGHHRGAVHIDPWLTDSCSAGTEVVASSPGAFAASIKTDAASMGKVIRGMRLQVRQGQFKTSYKGKLCCYRVS